jgi:hypothetical protein
MKGLRYILADLGHHAAIKPDHSVEVINGVVIFHTITNFRIWTSSQEIAQRTMVGENSWLRDEIVKQTPSTRPAFMSGLAISWYYFPAWIKDLVGRLPPEYKVVSPSELSRLYLQSKGKSGK